MSKRKCNTSGSEDAIEQKRALVDEEDLYSASSSDDSDDEPLYENFAVKYVAKAPSSTSTRRTSAPSSPHSSCTRSTTSRTRTHIFEESKVLEENEGSPQEIVLLDEEDEKVEQTPVKKRVVVQKEEEVRRLRNALPELTKLSGLTTVEDWKNFDFVKEIQDHKAEDDARWESIVTKEKDLISAIGTQEDRDDVDGVAYVNHHERNLRIFNQKMEECKSKLQSEFLEESSSQNAVVSLSPSPPPETMLFKIVNMVDTTTGFPVVEVEERSDRSFTWIRTMFTKRCPSVPVESLVLKVRVTPDSPLDVVPWKITPLKAGCLPMPYVNEVWIDRELEEVLKLKFQTASGKSAIVEIEKSSPFTVILDELRSRLSLKSIDKLVFDGGIMAFSFTPKGMEIYDGETIEVHGH